MRRKNFWNCSTFWTCAVVIIATAIVFFFFGGCAMRPRLAPKTTVHLPEAKLEVFGLARDSFSSWPGIVPVVVENSDIKAAKVLVFSGSDRIEMIHDAAGGSWVFNKPPKAWFRLDPRHGGNWYTYGVIYLPANTTWTFMIIREGPFGDSLELDYQIYVRSSNTPFDINYYRRAPYSGGVYKTGGFVSLPMSYNNYRSLQVSLEIDPVREVGRGIQWLKGGAR